MLVIRNLNYFLDKRDKGDYNSLDNMSLDRFQKFDNYFIFTVKELSNKFFFSCSALTTFFSDNIDIADFDRKNNAYMFSDDTVKFTFCGKFPCKHDNTKSFNKFEIIVE